MTLHKLSAGSGYEYLTRQVAALDSTEKGRTTLADYYSAKGESPGRWVGTGLVGLHSLADGDVVTAEQMKHLFGTGSHPLTGAALGKIYQVFDNSIVDEFNAEVGRRVRVASDGGKSYEPLALARTEVAREWFERDHGRSPVSASEISDAVRRYSRPRQTAVAGYDLTFSPVKSVSTLWAVAPGEVARVIETAHDAAVRDALDFIEREVLFTREGRGGARQVETRGLIATAFTHRDSRAGDPDLHTHVAVSNKVQTLQGKWLAIYGKVLYEHIVAASETYNTALELRLTKALGVRFADRAELSTGSISGRGKRPVREIEGVDPALCQRWSRRRTDITVRQVELARDFQKAHRRPPTAVESVALAQQANLETREAKHEPRSYADQRRTWLDEAADLLGSRQALSAMVTDVVSRRLSAPPQPPRMVTVDWIREVAKRVIEELEGHQATWRTQHVKAEVQRRLRGIALPIDRATQVARLVADEVVAHSVNVTPDTDPIADPTALRRSDGTSVYRHTGTDHYTSRRLLDAEQRIVATAGQTGGAARTVDEVGWSVLVARLHDVPLNRGQEALVTAMATSGRRVQLALAPAGSGKTTAMQVLAATWTARESNAVGLAPSAAAAAALVEATGMPCETLAKLDHDLAHSPGSALVASIRPGTLLVIDEAGMADTLTLDRVVAYAAARDAVVRLIGDDQQLAAVGAGGVLRDIVTTHGALHLDELVRFADPAEATASLDLRDGDTAALGFYLDHERVHFGDVDGCADEVFEAWVNERAGGRDCLMLAPTRDLVRELNLRAQGARDLRGPSVRLSDDCDARVGDLVITRRNDRRLGVSASDWVKNGDRWSVTAIKDGGISVQHRDSGLRTTLPAEYVAEHVELGYASTVHIAQGLTTDVMHGIVTGQETRQTLYTMLSRGRIDNHVHVVLTEADDDHALPSPRLDRGGTATELLEGIVSRDGAAVSATTTRAVAASPERQLQTAVGRYGDALALAASKLHVNLEEAPAGPLPWLAGVHADLAEHPAWGSYLVGRARRVSILAAQVRARADVTLPEWIHQYDDVLTPDLRADLAVWRAACGVRANDRTMAGPTPSSDDEASYHRHLTRTINARNSDVIKGWEERIVQYVGSRDEQTVGLARQLDKLQRRGVDAELVLSVAIARKPLPVERPTAALAYRVRSVVAASQRRQAPTPEPFARRPQHHSGPAMGL